MKDKLKLLERFLNDSKDKSGYYGYRLERNYLHMKYLEENGFESERQLTIYVFFDSIEFLTQICKVLWSKEYKCIQCNEGKDDMWGDSSVCSGNNSFRYMHDVIPYPFAQYELQQLVLMSVKDREQYLLDSIEKYYNKSK